MNARSPESGSQLSAPGLLPLPALREPQRQSASDVAARPRLFVLLMVILAATACALVEASSSKLPVQTTLFPTAVQAGVMIALSFVLTRKNWIPSPRWVDGIVVAAFVWTYLPGSGAAEAALETRLLVSLRNIAITAGAVGVTPRGERMAVGASFGLILYAFALGGRLDVALIALAYFALGIGLLISDLWTTSAARPVLGRPLRFPLAPLAGLIVWGLVAAAGTAIMYPDATKELLSAIAPLDGNSNTHRQRSRLLDENDEDFEGLAKKKYGTGAGQGSAALGTNGAADEEARAFSLIRKLPVNDSGVGAGDEVLFQFQGSDARHLKMTQFDRLDGTTWRGKTLRGGLQLSAIVAGSQGWFNALQPADFDLDPENGNGNGADLDTDLVEWSRQAALEWMMQRQGGGRLLKSQQLPFPNGRLRRLLAGLPGNVQNVDHVLTPYDLAALKDRLDSLPLSPDDRADALANEYSDELLRLLLQWRRDGEFDTTPPEIAELAERWTAAAEPGWPRIEALIQGLRAHAEHDPTVVAPESHHDPVAWFLLEKRRGPDYLFASAAAILLRHLGHSSQVVGGFYVAPDRRSWLTGTTPVRRDDVHYWTQVRLPDGTWIDLEPTPGYDIAAPQASVGIVRRTWSYLTSLTRVQLGAISGMVLAIGAMVRMRKRIFERLATLCWLFGSRRRIDPLVHRTWRLIERRAALAGQPRPPGRPLAAWYPQIFADSPELARRLRELATLNNQLLHGPQLPGGRQPAAPAVDVVRQSCRQLTAGCTVRQFRYAACKRPATA